ncbi:phosphotransferase [Kitasatospora sp. MAP5-34]|uniref:phosphotransferase n=1 Tax=Kitasatospora sp. MAP5-34 TaxID=3035102 RepID=UPI0024763B8B|nr:phosphotransferase [Kitasatospora sp. MAP5-34]
MGVIDFDDCGTGSFLLDIATVLSSVYRAAGGEPEAYAAFADAYLAGYSRLRPLPKGFNDLVEAYVLLRDTIILNFVTAAVPANAAVTEWGPRRIAGILASMAEHLEGQPYPGTIRWQGAHPQ